MGCIRLDQLPHSPGEPATHAGLDSLDRITTEGKFRNPAGNVGQKSGVLVQSAKLQLQTRQDRPAEQGSVVIDQVYRYSSAKGDDCASDLKLLERGRGLSDPVGADGFAIGDSHVDRKWNRLSDHEGLFTQVSFHLACDSG